MTTDERLRDVALFVKSIDAKVDVMRTAFIALASLLDEESRRNFPVRFDRELQRHFATRSISENSESYFDELRRHSYKLKELLEELTVRSEGGSI